ncbi:MAG TPA: LptF/LptG family permease [Sphaerochaeta sp.]|jgi:lipopolysaccharide export system permease protein|nr:YjgP/YjgQ family permease [Spirochaetales bacterium]HPX29068.1 LptF/LptG family permease [Sphaerochaeta sp.]HQB54417.1 LptF/LptG family permease [Sphaerochaeta sp.]
MTRRHTLVYRHVSREYLLSFFVAFLFFFFIFFINQILLLAKRILIKQVDYYSVFKAILYSIPQFLLFTFPFSSLTASSMTLGDLGEHREILALRCNGISPIRLYLPILLISLGITAATFITADYILPVSSARYRELYTSLMQNLPTLELVDGGINTIGTKTLINKTVDENRVDELILFDSSSREEGKILTAPSATVTLDDPLRFVYLLELNQPRILYTRGGGEWALAHAERAQLFLDFSKQVGSLGTVLPSQLSSRQLQAEIAQYRISFDEEMKRYEETLSVLQEEVKAGTKSKAELNEFKKQKPINFYLQYYTAELHKKYALSTACTILLFLTFVLGYLRLRHGKLIGFGLSMITAVIYWYLLFFSQLQIFSYPVSAALFIWAPNIILGTLGILLLLVMRRS